MYLCTMEDVNVLHMFLSVHAESSRRITCVLPVYDGLRGLVTCGPSCARWTTWTYYTCSYLFIVDQVDVLPVFLPVHDILSVYITCISTCTRWTTWTYYTCSCNFFSIGDNYTPAVILITLYIIVLPCYSTSRFITISYTSSIVNQIEQTWLQVVTYCKFKSKFLHYLFITFEGVSDLGFIRSINVLTPLTSCSVKLKDSFFLA